MAKNTITIFNETKDRIPRKKIFLIAKGIFKEKKSLNIIFFKNNNIKTLNKKYRNKDYATNILTFNFEDYSEIYLSPQIIKKDAKENGITFKKELLFLLIHGLLHSIGYKHGAKMEKMEDHYSKKYDI